MKKKRNPIAKSLKLHKPKVITPKKGKGSYSRKDLDILVSGITKDNRHGEI